jgi:hypothetical protein
VCVWNLVDHTKGRKQTEDYREQGADGNVWTEEGWNNTWLEKGPHNFYYSPNIIRKFKWLWMIWTGNVTYMRENTCEGWDSIGKPEYRPRCRLQDNIKMVEKWNGCVDWIKLAENSDQYPAVVSMTMSFRASWIAGNILRVWVTSGLLRRTQIYWVSYIYTFDAGYSWN